MLISSHLINKLLSHIARKCIFIQLHQKISLYRDGGSENFSGYKTCNWWIKSCHMRTTWAMTAMIHVMTHIMMASRTYVINFSAKSSAVGPSLFLSRWVSSKADPARRCYHTGMTIPWCEVMFDTQQILMYEADICLRHLHQQWNKPMLKRRTYFKVEFSVVRV